MVLLIRATITHRHCRASTRQSMLRSAKADLPRSSGVPVLSMDTRVKPAYDGPEKNVSDLATFRLT
ncbi:MAG: hypothetical protein ABSA90_18445, partial [Xanthobacteraceae bacterium]